MRGITAFISAILLISAPGFAAEKNEVFEKVKDSVVTIKTFDDRNALEGEGSGIVIARGQVVTNCHVVEDAGQIRVRSDAREFEATVVSGNVKRDLCRLNVKDLTAPSVVLRSSADLKPGEPVYAVGNPLGFGLAVSTGLVSAVKRDGDTVSIYTSAPTSPGSSGGGLFDGEGKLIGITTSGYTGAQNFNVALPAEWITDLSKNSPPWNKPPKVDPDPDWVGRAEALREVSDWVKLENHARKWQKEWPTSSAADTYLGQALTNQKKNREAREELLSALKKDPLNATALAYLSAVRRSLGDKKGAWEDIERARALQPSSGYFYQVAASYYYQDGDVEGAVKALKTGLRMEPWVWQSWEFLGEILHNRHLYQEAESAYRTVLRLRPGDPTATENLVKILLATDKLFQAGKLLEKDTSLDVMKRADLWLQLGISEENKNHFPEAEKAFGKAGELNPVLPQAWFGLGNSYRRSGRNQEAETAFRKAVKLEPGLSGAWLALGLLLEGVGRKAEAEEAYLKATSADPNLASAWMALGYMYFNERKYDSVVKPLTKGTALDPADAQAWAFLGVSLVRLGQADKAREALLKAEKLDAKNPHALEGLSMCYGLLQDNEQSLKYSERSLAVAPASPSSWSNKGYALLKLRRYPEAVQALETAVRLQPDFAAAWINLGEALMRQKQMGRAISALEEAVKLKPTATDARLFLAECYGATGQFERAESNLDVVVETAPKMPSAWFMRTVLFMEQKKRLDALASYAHLKSLNPQMAKLLRDKYRMKGIGYELPE
jgi:tetratricopeptide (TPR) repeat protein